MALRKIVLQGEPCLTKVCRPVTEFNGRLHTLLDDLKDTLLDSGGVGLAAPQVGILRRVCVVMNEDDEIIELVNPEIIATDGEQTGLEGCLSVPGKFGIVTRPYTVRVRAQDRDGAFFEVEDEALTARCFQHCLSAEAILKQHHQACGEDSKAVFLGYRAGGLPYTVEYAGCSEKRRDGRRFL